jgi:uncharacterized membrane protein
MSIIDILIIGYLANIVAFFAMTFLIITSAFFAQPTVEAVKQHMNLKKSFAIYETTRLLCKKYKVSTLVQDDFLFLLPFSGLLNFVIFIAESLNFGVTGYLIKKINNKSKILIERLERLDVDEKDL